MHELLSIRRNGFSSTRLWASHGPQLLNSGTRHVNEDNCNFNVSQVNKGTLSNTLGLGNTLPTFHIPHSTNDTFIPSNHHQLSNNIVWKHNSTLTLKATHRSRLAFNGGYVSCSFSVNMVYPARTMKLRLRAAGSQKLCSCQWRNLNRSEIVIWNLECVSFALFSM